MLNLKPSEPLKTAAKRIIEVYTEGDVGEPQYVQQGVFLIYVPSEDDTYTVTFNETGEGPYQGTIMRGNKVFHFTYGSTMTFG